MIAVTDHDHVEGARRVEELLAEQDSPVRMITGVEVSTRHGHLLGLFVKKAPRPMRPVQESIDAIKEQGGLVIVPHPFGRLVPSLSRRRIDSLLAAGYEIDGIETYNPSPANATQRAAVRRPTRSGAWPRSVRATRTSGSTSVPATRASPAPRPTICAGRSSTARCEPAGRSSGRPGSTRPPMSPNAPGAGSWTRRAACSVDAARPGSNA